MSNWHEITSASCWARRRGSAPRTREQLRRAARRELALLEGADHRGILCAVELDDHELGPALVLDASPQDVRLDHWLAEHGARLSLLDRLALIRALAEPVATPTGGGWSRTSPSSRMTASRWGADGPSASSCSSASAPTGSTRPRPARNGSNSPSGSAPGVRPSSSPD